RAQLERVEVVACQAATVEAHVLEDRVGQVEHREVAADEVTVREMRAAERRLVQLAIDERAADEHGVGESRQAGSGLRSGCEPLEPLVGVPDVVAHRVASARELSGGGGRYPRTRR